MIYRLLRFAPLLVLLSASALATNQEPVWRVQNSNGEVTVELYFFWSLTCPHCQDARPHIEAMAREHPWMQLKSREISRHPEHVELYRHLADLVGIEARSVPAFFICGQVFIGWDNPDGMGRALLQSAQQCRVQGIPATEQGAPGARTQHLPWLGEMDPASISLPLLTLVLAGLDAFNPCAFFILLFLLSLLVHARSRRKMLLVGMVFVVISGLIYFLFMAAWLNLFLLVGSMAYITFGSGLLALVIGWLNVREYFTRGRRVGLVIPDAVKPGLFKRMGGLLSVNRLPALLFGTVTLAVAVNSYELLCTAGFPMVYTRTLTLHQLDTMEYYLYLTLYNVVYVIPLLLIVALFTFTLGSRKLTEYEGQLLKLMSGVMMLLLGAVLMLRPELIANLYTGLALLLSALILVAAIHRLRQR